MLEFDYGWMLVDSSMNREGSFMADKENIVKMQKLRRTVDRLRNMRSTGTPAVIRKTSWFARLKVRLGLTPVPEGAEE